ncbi:MAG: hypothetical protein ACYC6V_03120 [Bacillota bacterium]
MFLFINPTWLWPGLAVIVWVATLALVPPRRFGALLPIGLIGGFFLTLAIQYLAIDVLDLWRFNLAFAGPTIYLTPLWLLIAYVPEVILFIHHYPVNNVSRVFYIVLFALANTLIEWAFVGAGLRSYIHWNVLFTFALAVVVHLIVLGLYVATGGREKLATGEA